MSDKQNNNDVKRQFIDYLVDCLNKENTSRILKGNQDLLDVCFMVSVLDEQNNDFKEFFKDIANNEYLIDDFEEVNDYFIIGKVKVYIMKNESCIYYYEVVFLMILVILNVYLIVNVHQMTMVITKNISVVAKIVIGLLLVLKLEKLYRWDLQRGKSNKEIIGHIKRNFIRTKVILMVS